MTEGMVVCSFFGVPIVSLLGQIAIGFGIGWWFLVVEDLQMNILLGIAGAIIGGKIAQISTGGTLCYIAIPSAASGSFFVLLFVQRLRGLDNTH
jgi:hypothetical protein